MFLKSLRLIGTFGFLISLPIFAATNPTPLWAKLLTNANFQNLDKAVNSKSISFSNQEEENLYLCVRAESEGHFSNAFLYASKLAANQRKIREASIWISQGWINRGREVLEESSVDMSALQQTLAMPYNWTNASGLPLPFYMRLLSERKTNEFTAIRPDFPEVVFFPKVDVRYYPSYFQAQGIMGAKLYVNQFTYGSNTWNRMPNGLVTYLRQTLVPYRYQASYNSASFKKTPLRGALRSELTNGWSPELGFLISTNSNALAQMDLGIAWYQALSTSGNQDAWVLMILPDKTNAVFNPRSFIELRYDTYSFEPAQSTALEELKAFVRYYRSAWIKN